MLSSVAHPVQLHLAAEDPVDADRVGEHDRHADERDGEHDAQRLRRGGGVVDRQAVSRRPGCSARGSETSPGRTAPSARSSPRTRRGRRARRGRGGFRAGCWRWRAC